MTPTTPKQQPLRSKNFEPSHVTLLRAALDCRTILRAVMPKLPPEHQMTIARASNVLTFGMKARGASTAQSGANSQQSASEDTPRRQTIFRPGTPSEGIPIAQSHQLQPPKTKGMEADAEGQ